MRKIDISYYSCVILTEVDVFIGEVERYSLITLKCLGLDPSTPRVRFAQDDGVINYFLTQQTIVPPPGQNPFSMLLVVSHSLTPSLLVSWVAHS